VLTPGEVRVWRVDLPALRIEALPQASAAERERAARFVTETLRERYLRSHRALRAVLSGLTAAPLEFAVHEKGKPYLPAAPELRFNLSHAADMALIAAALDVEVGVDIELVRDIPRREDIAARFFPPSEAAAMAEAQDGALGFFRRWTRIEAMLKARGDGLYGAGAEITGEWTVKPVEVPGAFVATVAAAASGMSVAVTDLR
jgi:4'-phosphopantetheinyl transferase